MLTPEQLELLNFETLHPGIGNTKTNLIYRHHKGDPAHYWQTMHQLAHNPEAIAAYPMTCARIQRLEQAAERRRWERSRMRRV